MDARCFNVPFPNLGNGRFGEFWATYMRRPDDQTCDVIVSTKLGAGRISPPLMHISGFSTDFTTATGQWKLCETEDPELRKQQQRLIDKLVARDHSTLLLSAPSVRTGPVNHTVDRAEVRYPLLRRDVEGNGASAIPTVSSNESPAEQKNLSSPSVKSAASSETTVISTRQAVGDGKSRDCNRDHTFDIFLNKNQLGEDDAIPKRDEHGVLFGRWTKRRVNKTKVNKATRQTMETEEAQFLRYRQECSLI